MNNDRFRIWDKALKTYNENYFYIHPTGKLFRLSIAGELLRVDSTRFERENCTGLLDKNGRLIYAGDVVSFSWQLKDNEVCKIVWDKIHCSFACVDIKTGADFITWYSVFENGQSDRCEIIGNIHKPGA